MFFNQLPPIMSTGNIQCTILCIYHLPTSAIPFLAIVTRDNRKFWISLFVIATLFFTFIDLNDSFNFSYEKRHFHLHCGKMGKFSGVGIDITNQPYMVLYIAVKIAKTLKSGKTCFVVKLGQRSVLFIPRKDRSALVREYFMLLNQWHFTRGNN